MEETSDWKRRYDGQRIGIQRDDTKFTENISVWKTRRY